MRAQQCFDTSQTVCYKCSREFPSIFMLKEHFEDHARLKNYSCTLCHLSYLECELLKQHLKSDYHLSRLTSTKTKKKVKYFAEKYKRPSQSNKCKEHIKILKGVHREPSRYPDKYWYFGWQLGQIDSTRSCKKVLHTITYLSDLTWHYLLFFMFVLDWNEIVFTYLEIGRHSRYFFKPIFRGECWTTLFIIYNLSKRNLCDVFSFVFIVNFHY